jgi:hypothetical protein
VGSIQPFVDKLPPQAMPLVLQSSPLPESTAKELGEIIAKARGPPKSRPSFSR